MRIRTVDEAQAQHDQHRREHDDICLGGESCEFCCSRAALIARIDELEAFAHQALMHLNDHIFGPTHASNPEQLLKDAQDFVHAHCNDGAWDLSTITVDHAYLYT